jgi:hypothetical protein
MFSIIISLLIIFVIWSILDFVVHLFILAKDYEESMEVWRNNMKLPLLYLSTFLMTGIFITIYAMLIPNHNMHSSLTYSLILGFGVGFSASFSSYASSPIPFRMAMTQFINFMIKYALAGIVIGMIIK